MSNTAGLNLKIREDERQALKTAAGIAGTSLTEYIRGTAVVKARQDIDEFARKHVDNANGK